MNLRTFLHVLVPFLCWVLSAQAWSACPSEADYATRFASDSANPGLIFDRQRNITWSRCTYGQQWAGISCQGIALYRSYNQVEPELAKSGWRLPTKDELMSLVDTCRTPRLDMNRFMGTYFGDLGATYLTSESVDRNDIYAFDFNKGLLHKFGKGDGARIRAVKDGIDTASAHDK